MPRDRRVRWADGTSAPNGAHNWRTEPRAADVGDDRLLHDAPRNILEALQRNVEAKQARYGKKDLTLSQVMATDVYWSVYTRMRGTELAKLVEETMRATFKNAAEQAAWGPLLRSVKRDEA